MAIDLDFLRKMANTYDVEDSEQNAINDFVHQSNKIYDATLSMYDILSPSNRGDAVVITTPDGTTKDTRAVFNYNKEHTASTLKNGEERCYLAFADGEPGNYVSQTSTSDVFLILYKDKNRFDFDDVAVMKCDIDLKWTENSNEYSYKSTSKILSESSHGYNSSQNIDIISGSMIAYVQRNDDTKRLYPGQRFIIENNAYSIKSIESIYPKNCLTIFFEVDSVNKDTDDLVNDVADNDNPSGWDF